MYESWLSMRNFLGRRGVKEEILNFDVKRITGSIRKAVGKLLKKNGSSFEHKVIYRVSVAAAPLASWVKANIRYSVVLNKVQPLTDELERANRLLQEAAEKLEENQQELKVRAHRPAACLAGAVTFSSHHAALTLPSRVSLYDGTMSGHRQAGGQAQEGAD